MISTFAKIRVLLTILTPSITAFATLPAVAQNRWISTIWTIEPTNEIPAEREYAGGELLLKQRLVPAGLVRASDDFSDADLKMDAPKGTQFFQIDSDAGRAFCDGRQNGKKANSKAYLCLVDRDQDGRFESAFKGLSDTDGIPTIGGKFPKSLKLISPIAYERLDPREFAVPYFVAIQRRNFFNIYGRESFMIRFGTDVHSQEITDPVQFKATELPKEMTIMGARFTAIGEVAGKIRIKVYSTMPKQPFGVMRTISFR